jgi:hypothetical protein
MVTIATPRFYIKATPTNAQEGPFDAVLNDDGEYVAPTEYFARLAQRREADAQADPNPAENTQAAQASFNVSIAATEHTPAYGPFEVTSDLLGRTQYPPAYHAAMAQVNAVLLDVAMHGHRRSGKTSGAAARRGLAALLRKSVEKLSRPKG